MEKESCVSPPAFGKQRYVQLCSLHGYSLRSKCYCLNGRKGKLVVSGGVAYLIKDRYKEYSHSACLTQHVLCVRVC
jgi:hypothetical protein